MPEREDERKANEVCFIKCSFPKEPKARNAIPQSRADGVKIE